MSHRSVVYLLHLSAVVLVVLFGLVLSNKIMAQDGGSPDSLQFALKQAALFLSKQRGKPIPSVDNYTYSQEIFTDESLGCPQQGKTYPPASLDGYKLLITVNGITYEVHITL